ncbi:double-headed protease inhibitor, submandibular gland-like, partial [Eurosta solidaginis]|uniref:double-headed protease inhibitor, submandibular gland-like n=1 Tax=Eurosta solidaginis TaxID=178769 RepID=UPI0035309A87
FFITKKLCKMRISIKFSIISLSLMLLCCCGIYRASIGVEAGAVKNVAERCLCGRIYQPVCASNMKTYANRCLYEYARKKLANRGRSLALLRSGVCGNEQLRRSNILAEEIITADDLKLCSCDRSLLPVCGSDKRTYPNRCLFDCKRNILARSGRVLTLLRKGAC